MKTYAIVVAAGSGSRAGGGIPKQFTDLAGKPVFEWSFDCFIDHPAIDQTVLVVPAAWIDDPIIERAAERALIVSGGDSRSDSVLKGLQALDARDDDIVLIHDAARPGLRAAVIDALVEALTQADSAAPALLVNDAVKRQEGSQLHAVSRDNLFRVQTPQAFRSGLILRALSQRDRDYVDDLEAVEALGATIKLVKGDERLNKLTYAEDRAVLETALKPRGNVMRVGSGFDVHAFEPGDGVTLCGVVVPFDKRLKGHSDADVGWHALTDAIFGALGLGDLGDHFPPSDPQWKDADSGLFLKHAVSLISDRGWSVANCDITLICEAPKVKPHRETMRQRTADVLAVDVERISIKATTTERLGFLGRAEGIAAQAVVMLEKEG